MSALMIQGTGSNVGKTILVAGLCRALKRRGVSVAPFKPQNMSNNAAVTMDGGEIGRAQALQAMACGIEPLIDMNPVLLKPEASKASQVIVQGKRFATVDARKYANLKPKLMPRVLESFERLKKAFDVVLVEGAGSPAEVNLRSNDIANMGFAQAAKVPVIIVGDIDRGGIIAQLVGTKCILGDKDQDKIVGFLVNKFRGDPSLFDEGYALIEKKTGWKGFGVLPFFEGASKLPAEDSKDLIDAGARGTSDIICLGLPRIANFDDLDPISNDSELNFSLLKDGQSLPGNAKLVIIPGSKSTRSDLDFIIRQGWDIDLLAHYRRGGHILGICGGYQILGKEIEDISGIEGSAGKSKGLGFLDVRTVMTPEKSLAKVKAVHAVTGLPISGYEIHIGRTEGPDCKQPFARIGNKDEGAMSLDGRICGSYIHGMFSGDEFRRSFFRNIGLESAKFSYEQSINDNLDALADHLESHIALSTIFNLVNSK